MSLDAPEQQNPDGLLFERVEEESEVMQMSKGRQTLMTVGRFREILTDFNIQDDFELWLSSDEEGNEFLPVLANPQCSLAIEEDEKRITLFPSHR